MDLLEVIEKIEYCCYADKYKEALEEVQFFLSQMQENDIDTTRILPVLRVLLEAMKTEDNILIGDCLEFGVKPAIKGTGINNDLFERFDYIIPDIGEDIFYYSSFEEEPVLCVKDDNGKIVRLNSFFSPTNEVSYWISNTNIKKNTPVVCLFGIGTGLFAEALLNKLALDSRLLIFEPDRRVINYCLSCGQRTDSEFIEELIGSRIQRVLTDNRVSLCVESDSESMFRMQLENLIGYMNLRGLIVVKHNNYDRIYSKSCLRFLREINDYRAMMITNKNTMGLFKESLIENVFKNMFMYRRMNKCSEISKILPQNIPVIIVSAGPSLDKNIEELRNVKGHCLIFAVDSALKHLLKKGIIPDLTITIDSRKDVSCFADELSHDIPCLFDVTANPEIVSKHKGRVIVFNNSDVYMANLFNAINKTLEFTPNGGSVATAAFALLCELGQKKIILIGQDLASTNGVTHAGGGNDQLGYEKSIVEGYYGGKVTTRSDWLGYLKWFEKATETVLEKRKDLRIINATEGGAKIHGMEMMSLKDAIETCKDSNGHLPEYDFKKHLDELGYYLDDDEYKELINKHFDAIDKLKEIEKNSDEAERICNMLLKGIKEESVSASYIDKEKKKISKINEFCSRSLAFPLVNNFLISGIIDEISRLRLEQGDIKSTELNGINLMKISFEAISEASRNIYKKAIEIRNQQNLLD